MKHKYFSEEQVKNALNVDSFREISKEKIMEFASMIPQIDKDVAISIINQFPSYSDSAKTIISQLRELAENAIKDNNDSKKRAADAYTLILNELSVLLKKDDISKEERDEITDKMINVADKIADLDEKNLEFLKDVVKSVGYVGLGALFLGAAILGVNVKGVKLPSISKK